MVHPFAEFPLLIRTKHLDVLLRPAIPQMHTMLWNAAIRTDHKSAARYYAGMSTVSLPAPETRRTLMRKILSWFGKAGHICERESPL